MLRLVPDSIIASASEDSSLPTLTAQRSPASRLSDSSSPKEKRKVSCLSPQRPTLAIDCDLRKIYATDNTGRVHAKAEPDARTGIHRYIEANPNSCVLFEIASPLFYRESPRAVYHTARWALWNMAMARFIEEDCDYHGIEFLVSPSSSWTMGHGLLARHRIAACQQPEKNLRETEAMIFFYQHNPDQWLSLKEYLDAI